MKKITLLAVIVMATATLPVASAAKWTATLEISIEACTNVGRNAFFVLEPGYQLVLTGKEQGRQTELIITVLDETREVEGVSTRVIEERESADGKLVEVSRNFLAIGLNTKNVYYFGEDVDIYKSNDQITHEGSWRAGQAGAKRGILMPGRVKAGDRYYQEYAEKLAMDCGENVALSEKVKTPAGEFKNCLKVKETTPLEPGTEFKYYAPDIGLVREGHLKLVKYGFVKK